MDANAVYEKWIETLLNERFSDGPDEFAQKLRQMFIQAHQNGRSQEIQELGTHLSRRCGGGRVTIPQIGMPIDHTKGVPEIANSNDGRKNILKIPSGEMSAIYCKVMSDDKYNRLDLLVKVERGGSFNVRLPSEDQDKGYISLPSTIPTDQKRVIARTGELVPAAPGDDFNPPWGEEDDVPDWSP